MPGIKRTNADTLQDGQSIATPGTFVGQVRTDPTGEEYRWSGSGWSIQNPARAVGAFAGLLYNGFGGALSNDNFSWATYKRDDGPVGSSGYFYTATQSFIPFCDRIIPVNPAATYVMNTQAKAFVSIGVSKAFYSGCIEFDLDNNQISPQHHMFFAGSTQTTLTRIFIAGATKMYVADATGWQNAAGAGGYERVARFGKYKTLSGKSFGNYDYSRWCLGGISGALGVGTSNPGTDMTQGWAAGSIANIGGGEWEITLISAVPAFPADLAALYPSGLPIGHPVCNSTSGSSYKYFGTNGTGYTMDGSWLTAWKAFSGAIGGIDSSGTNVQSKFTPAAAGIKIMFLPNYGGTGTAETGLVAELLRIDPFNPSAYDVPGTYTYNIPPGTSQLEGELSGGGGGSGSGRKGASATVRCGGGGGGAGGRTREVIRIKDLPAGTTSLEIVVGAGGVAGAAQATNSTNGNGGGNGGETYIRHVATNQKLVRAGGGIGGSGGTAGAGVGGTGSSLAWFPGASGASASTTGLTGSAGGASVGPGAAGGGSGGGLSAANAASAGGAGGVREPTFDGAGAGLAGAINLAGGAGGNALLGASRGGGGGGAGGSSLTGNGGNGGNGGSYGAGAGGGGAAVDDVGNSGAGAVGGGGIVVITPS